MTDKEAPDPGTSGYHSVAQGQSSSIYSSDAVLPSTAVVLSDGELESVAKAEKNRATAAMLTISGTSQTSKVKIGGKISVELPKKMEVDKKDVDTFLVTGVTHEYDLKGEYRNTFIAVPSTAENIPATPVYFPKAFPQIATVKTNDDEKKLGRVKVEFQWQKDKGKTTNWIRVQTPDAGPNPQAKKYKEVVPKNRGFVFIPENDDIVMIDFEYGDPNRPYVAGSIFSEKASSGGDTDNKKKTITTRTGSTITFDDSDGSILIQDHKDKDVYEPLSKSSIKMDGKQNIHINADTSILLTSGKSSILLKKDGTINIKGVNITTEASETITDKAMKNVNIEGTAKVEIASSAIIEEKAPKVSIAGKAQVEVSGTLVNVTATTVGNIKGMPLNLN